VKFGRKQARNRHGIGEVGAVKAAPGLAGTGIKRCGCGSQRARKATGGARIYMINTQTIFNQKNVWTGEDWMRVGWGI